MVSCLDFLFRLKLLQDLKWKSYIQSVAKDSGKDIRCLLLDDNMSTRI